MSGDLGRDTGGDLALKGIGDRGPEGSGDLVRKGGREGR